LVLFIPSVARNLIRRPKTNMKIQKKISVVFSVFVAAISLYVSAIFYERSMNAQTEDLRRNLTELAISASLMIDGDTHTKAYASGDMASPEYLGIRDILRRFKKEVPRVRYIYTMVRGDRPGVYKFAVDASEPLDENGDGKISPDEDVSPPGEEYDASDFPEMLSAFDGPAADKKLTSDKWGSFLSGYAPVYDSGGKAVAIVGIDVTAQTIVAEQRALQMRILAIFLSGVIMALFFSRMVSKGLTNPIQKLIDGTKILGGGDYSHKISLKTNDEIEFLADAMNSMGENINDKLQKLSTLNKVSETLSSSIELDKALKSSLDVVFELTSSPAGLILLTDSSENRVEIAISEGVRPPKFVENDAFIGHKRFDTRLSESFREWIKQPANNTAHGIDELKKIPEAAEAVEWLDAAECGYIAPLIFKDTLCGFLLYTNKLEGSGDFLRTLFYQITMAIENARLYYSAITDGLTGLYIHRYFQIQLEQEFLRARRYSRFFSLLMVDIDHFKSVNDTHGHQTGDAVLKEVAKILKYQTREIDMVARYGGEEMAIILPEASAEGALRAAEKIRATVERHTFSGGLNLTVSIGAATVTKESPADKESLIKQADAALYRAKEEGRNRVVVADVKGKS